MVFQIRSFKASDQQATRELILAGLGEHWGWIDETLNPDLDDITSNYLQNGYTFLIVESDDEIVGTGALITKANGTGRIVRMSVSKIHRRKGIGRAIVEHLLDAARSKGFSKVVVGTELEWNDAIGLYEQCGFSEYERAESGVQLSITLN